MRFRHWLGTSYKLTELQDDEQTLQSIAYQLEQCPTTGKTHLQFCLSFHHPRALTGVKRYIGDNTAHLEPTRNLNAALQYCNKLESRIGEPYLRHVKSDDWRLLTELQLWEQRPEWMLRHHVGVRRYFALQHTPTCQTRPTPTAIILYGPPGTGKSWSARQWTGPDFYIKPPGDFWIGYTGQKAIIFDDYYSSEKYDNLLRWISENPLHISIKGSSIELKATKFAFTSNTEPENWHTKIEDKSALWRRITKCFFCLHECFYIHELQ